MRVFLIFAVFLATAFQSLYGLTFGDYTYTSGTDEVVITKYNGTASSLIIPSSINGVSVVRIGASAFSQRTSLVNITIPDSVYAIDQSAFSDCTNLKTINIPASVREIMAWTFYNCSSLTSIILPEQTWNIYQYAFSGCTNLSYISVGSNLYTIGYAAFGSCAKLPYIVLSQTVITIGDAAFNRCNSLSSVFFLGNAPSNGLNIFYKDSSSVPAPSALTVYYLSGKTGWGTTYAGRPASITTSFHITTIFDANMGNVTASPNSASYMPTAVVSLQASPKAGYVFSGWYKRTQSEVDTGALMPGPLIGALSSFTFNDITNPSGLVSISDNLLITAIFSQDIGDNDNDGMSNYTEIISLGTDPNAANTLSPVQGLYTKAQFDANRTAGINDGRLQVTSSPNNYDLYTTSQIQNMAVGDLVLTKNSDGSFTLSYDIEKSSDLQSWLPYQSFELQLSNLPSDKAFIRIKTKQ